MKKILIISLSLVLLSSCLKESTPKAEITENVEFVNMDSTPFSREPSSVTVISTPVFPSTESCNSVSRLGYPSQDPTQYLHPETLLSGGKFHYVVFDHIATRKMIVVFGVSNLCFIDFWIKNDDPGSPFFGQILLFKDIYNWTDVNNNPLFNLNYEIYKYWGYSSTKETFPIRSKRSTTGEDMSFGHDSMTITQMGIDTVGYYIF